MAERPVFVPSHRDIAVREVTVQMTWNSGFAPIQKRKNIRELHRRAAEKGLTPLLEISTKSETELGRQLSAFNLQVDLPSIGHVPLECAFQGSKVFERGGPFTELWSQTPGEARKDDRLRTSGQLVAFRLQELWIPLQPKTLFYDWLYVSALLMHPEWHSSLLEYSGFTDIEFNPQRSLNCQARSCALFVSLLTHGSARYALRSPEDFETVVNYGYCEPA